MFAKDQLNQYRNALLDLSAREDAYIQVTCELDRVSASIASLPSSAADNRMGNLIVQREELAESFRSAYHNLLPAFLDVRNTIEHCKNTRWRRVLVYRYLLAMTWPDIAEKMECDCSTAKTMRDRALQQLSRGGH